MMQGASGRAVQMSNLLDEQINLGAIEKRDFVSKWQQQQVRGMNCFDALPEITQSHTFLASGTIFFVSEKKWFGGFGLWVGFLFRSMYRTSSAYPLCLNSCQIFMPGACAKPAHTLTCFHFLF